MVVVWVGLRWGRGWGVFLRLGGEVRCEVRAMGVWM